MKQLVDDGILAVTAGSDTTASALTSIFFCLLTHPDVYSLLREEVDKFYPRGEDAFATRHHADMSYMHAIMLVVVNHLIYFVCVNAQWSIAQKRGSQTIPSHHHWWCTPSAPQF